MSLGPRHDDIFDQAMIDEALQGLGTCNVLIAGRTGVGKSTLINAAFHGQMATTGKGRPVTETARLIRKEGVPLGIWDTRGLEMADFRETFDELIQLAEKRARDPDPEQHIHVAWLCIHEDGRRVQDAESSLCRTLNEHMPVLGVITKARSDEGFHAEVQRLLPEAGNVVRVRAISERINGHTLEPMGLEDLIEATVGLLPEGVQQAFAAAQRVSPRQKRERAQRCVWSSSAAAAVTGATPIPFSDAAVLVPIQVRMLVQISRIYGLHVTKSFVTRLVGLLGPVTTAGGRAIVTGLLKLVPGAGTVLGGVIGAATAGTLTAALGETYIAALDRVFATSKGDTPEPAAIQAEFRKRIRKRIKKTRRDTRRGRPRRHIGRLWPFGKRSRSIQDGDS